ncbi:MAG: tetratricopeptide repeat protein [Bacteroidia bacterium]|nr:tetratricopeptide repeat protein [Bacteroidia bacterium]
MAKDADFKLKLFLFLMAFALYANTIGFDYAWDDSIVITENPRVKKGISAIPDLFVKYHSDYKADKYGYRPITLCSFAIEYGLFKNTPAVSHFMNVIYFALLCMVMFGVLRKLFYKFGNLAPFLITVLYMVHPVHVEAVANIKSRDEIFALLFSLLSLSHFLNYGKSAQLKYLIYSVLLFVLAFLSKENAIVFLAIIPLTLLYPEGFGRIKQLVKPLLAILFLAIVSALILKLINSGSSGKQMSEGAGIYFEGGLLGNSFFYTDVFSTKIANALTVLLLYLKNFVWPLNLVYFYGYNVVPVASWSSPLVYVSLLLNLALIGFAVFRFKKYPEMAYGILFYFISISIYTHLFITLADTMADRFLFSPSLGLCIAVVFGAFHLFGMSLKDAKVSNFFSLQQNNTRSQKNFRMAFLLVALLLSIKTFTRNAVWKNDWTLTSGDMPRLENCSRAHNYYADNLKKKLMQNYNPEVENEMIQHYQKSIAISKEAYYSQLSLADYYNKTGRFNEAIVLLDTMLAIFPNQADPHFYMGDALYSAGNYTKAKTHLLKSLQLAPEVLITYFRLAITQSRLGEFEEAFKTVETARAKFSESSYIYEALGAIYFEKKEMELSTKATLEMLRFGADPQKVYGAVIGRYQTLKQDSLAKKYYVEAQSKGLFRQGGR